MARQDRPVSGLRHVPPALVEIQHLPHCPEGGLPLRFILLGGQGHLTVRGRASDLANYEAFRLRVLDALGVVLPASAFDRSPGLWGAEVHRALLRRTSAEGRE